MSGNLSFTPAQNLRGTALVTAWLRDNGGHANGDQGTSLPQTFTITVGTTTDSNHNGLPDDWEMAYGLALDPSSDAGADEDGDGFTNLQEYAAGTDPRNPSSSLGITDIGPAPAGLMISFKTVLGKRYAVDYQDGDLNGSWTLLADAVNGTGAIAQAIDETAGSQARRFYRIRLLP